MVSMKVYSSFNIICEKACSRDMQGIKAKKTVKITLFSLWVRFSRDESGFGNWNIYQMFQPKSSLRFTLVILTIFQLGRVYSRLSFYFRGNWCIVLAPAWLPVSWVLLLLYQSHHIFFAFVLLIQNLCFTDSKFYPKFCGEWSGELANI